MAELKDVGLHFGSGDERKTIVDGFSATILRGDKVGLIGPNGAGKTTLLKLILGELKPDAAARVRRGTRTRSGLLRPDAQPRSTSMRRSPTRSARAANGSSSPASAST